MAPNGSRNPIRGDDIKAGILLVQQKTWLSGAMFLLHDENLAGNSFCLYTFLMR
jgi:hypothetical protein